MSGKQNIRLLPLAGAAGDDGPYCFLLMIDDCKILLDCGWDDRFDLKYIDEIMKYCYSIDAVLLSHSDRAHLGALPLLVKKGLRCPIYATVPVANLGKLVMYDWMNSHHNIEEFDVFNLDEIDAAWKSIIPINYNQRINLAHRNVICRAFNSGHSLGGAYWRITKTGEEAIIYAVAFNHRKEWHLNAMTYDFYRPHLFIMDSTNSLYTAPRRKQRDESLVKKIVDTATNGGEVMIVTDTAGRSLEIAFFLDSCWSAINDLKTTSLVLMSNVAASVVDHAKMHIDWMNKTVAERFETTAQNPFKFKHVHLVHRLQDLDRLRSPKVVLCSQMDMESGYSYELFSNFVADPRNALVLTSRPRANTIGHYFYQLAQDGAAGASRTFNIRKRIFLDGPELEEHRQRAAQKHAVEQEKRLEKFRKEQRLYVGASSSDESEDEEEIAKAVDKYIIETDVRNRKRKRKHEVRKHTQTVIPGISVKLIEESQFVEKPKEVSEDEEIEAEVEEIRKSKSRRVATDDIEMQNWDNPFDLYFRHHVLVYYGMGKSDVKKKKRAGFPMFSFDNDKRKMNTSDYGEPINPEIFQEKQRNDMFVPAPMQRPDEKPDEDKKPTIKDEETDGDESDKPLLGFTDDDWPTKCIEEQEEVQVLCSVVFIDFEGRVDGDALTSMLDQVKPRTLILVRGNDEENKHIKDYCAANFADETDVLAPTVGETISLGLNMQFMDIELTDDLCSRIKFKPLNDGGRMAWINARMLTRRRLKEKLPEEMRARYAEGGDEDTIVAEVCPPKLAITHESVYMNEVKLMDLRDEVRKKCDQSLTDKDEMVDLREGRLLIGQRFSMKRVDAGNFFIEGKYGASYFKWREYCVKKFAHA